MVAFQFIRSTHTQIRLVENWLLLEAGSLPVYQHINRKKQHSESELPQNRTGFIGSHSHTHQHNFNDTSTQLRINSDMQGWPKEGVK